ncbi:MAG: SHD1 domain-containing protein, partial [Planctomycetales bacterium]
MAISRQPCRWLVCSTAFCLALMFAALVSGDASAADTTSRTWRDTTGEFSIEATLVTVHEGKVHLRKNNGDVVRVQLTRLSNHDRDYIKGLSSVASTDSDKNQEIEKFGDGTTKA